MADAAQLSSLPDETPEGRRIVVLAKEMYGLRGRELGEMQAEFVPFSAVTRMSGINMDGRVIRKGATDAIAGFLKGMAGFAGRGAGGGGDGCAQRRHAAGGGGEPAGARE